MRNKLKNKPGIIILLLFFLGYFFVNHFAEPQYSNTPVQLSKANPPQIIMYSSYNCKYCELAKAFFKQHKLPYTEYNIDTSDKRAQMFYLLGGRGTPLLIINKEIIHGFDERLIRRAL